MGWGNFDIPNDISTLSESFRMQFRVKEPIVKWSNIWNSGWWSGVSDVIKSDSPDDSFALIWFHKIIFKGWKTEFYETKLVYSTDDIIM